MRESKTSFRGRSAAASETVLGVLSDWTPYVVAAAPALVIGHALYKHDQPVYIYIAAALAVELAGVLAGHTLSEARAHNAVHPPEQHRRLNPVGWALVAYVVASVMLSVVLDIVPQVVTVWPVLMPPLAAIVYYLYGERLVIRHASMSETQTSGREDTADDTSDTSDANQDDTPDSPDNNAPGASRPPLDLLAYLKANPRVSIRKAAEELRMSKGAVEKNLNDLKRDGLVSWDKTVGWTVSEIGEAA